MDSQDPRLPFVGRAKEKEKLESFCRDKKLKAAVLYGRKGVGKTALVRDFLSGRRGYYFSAYPTTGTMEVSLMEGALFGKREANDASDIPSEEAPDRMLSSLLEELSREAEKRTEDDPLILAIDHYPDFAAADSSFARILHEALDRVFYGKPFRLILMGDSYIKIKKAVSGRSSLWREEEILPLEIGPLDFSDAKAFFPGAGAEDALLLYGMTGGLPGRLVAVAGKTPEEAFQILTGREGSLWAPETHLAGELRELPYYNRILTAMSAGCSRVNEIASEVDKPKDIVVPYLNTLTRIGMVQKEHPVTEPDNRRKTRYSIRNLGDSFCYRYIVPNRDHLDFQERVFPALTHWLKDVFIEVCRQDILRASGRDQLPLRLDRIGNWWDNGEDGGTPTGFDLVGLGTCLNGEAAAFCICDYGEDEVEMQELKDLIELTGKAGRKETTFYVIFSRAGFHENARTVASAIRNIMLVTLDDIFRKE